MLSICCRVSNKLTVRDVYFQHYEKLIKVLPMNDTTFIAKLYASGLLNRNGKEAIGPNTMPTQANKAEYFLDNYIETGFIQYDGSNQLFLQLLNVMENSDYEVLKEVTEEIRRYL